MPRASESSSAPQKPPPRSPDAVYYARLRRRTHAALCRELADFDWDSLEPAAARKIHALLPLRYFDKSALAE